MVPSTNRIPPPSRAGPQLFASPVPSPPTMIGAGVPPPPKRTPPNPPRPPPPPSVGGAVPFGPHPVVMPFDTHFRLRFLTVSLLTSFRWLNRLPVKSPE